MASAAAAASGPPSGEFERVPSPPVHQSRQGLVHWSNQNRGKAGAFMITATALATLVVLGAALVAYMHFSGTGLNLAGFKALGSQLTNLGQLIEKKVVALGHWIENTAKSSFQVTGWGTVAIVGGSVGAVALLCLLGKGASACNQRLFKQNREQRAEWRIARTEAAAAAAPTTTTTTTAASAAAVHVDE